VDWSDRHVGFDQLRVLDLVGALFFPRRPCDCRVDDKGGAFADRIEHDGFRRLRSLLRIEHITAITHLYLGFEMRRLEMIVADLKHLPEGHVRIGTVVRQVRRRHAERISLDLE
jgi:hypothetical protein